MSRVGPGNIQTLTRRVGPGWVGSGQDIQAITRRVGVGLRDSTRPYPRVLTRPVNYPDFSNSWGLFTGFVARIQYLLSESQSSGDKYTALHIENNQEHNMQCVQHVQAAMKLEESWWTYT